MSEQPRGRFTVVGIGPGDPELITIKAARIIGEADVVAFHAGVSKQSHARRIAAHLIPAGVLEEELRYPVTTGSTDHPGGYVGAMADFYESCAARLGAHLDAVAHDGAGVHDNGPGGDPQRTEARRQVDVQRGAVRRSGDVQAPFELRDSLVAKQDRVDLAGRHSLQRLAHLGDVPRVRVVGEVRAPG